MDHQEIEELLSAFVLESLKEEERDIVEKHLLSGCERCNRLLKEFQIVTEKLAHTAPIKQPPPELKNKIFGLISSKKENVSETLKEESFWFSWLISFRWAAIGTVGLLLGVGLYSFFKKTSNIDSPKLIAFAGQVTVNGGVAESGSIVNIGSKIKTGPNSKGEIQFGNRAILRIGPDSDIVLTETKTEIIVRLNKGSALNIVKPGTHYRIKTSAAVAAVRGTTFFIQAKSENESYVCICSGRLGVSSSGLDKEIESPHHRAVEVKQFKGKAQDLPSTLLYHSDEDIRSLENLFR